MKKVAFVVMLYFEGSGLKASRFHSNFVPLDYLR